MSAQITVVASENAGLTGAGTFDESTVLDLRDRFGYAGQTAERYAYLRFSMDAANDTFGGIAANDITSVTLGLYFTSFTNASGQVFILSDNANPGVGFLTETTWAATGANELSGPIAPHGNQDAVGSPYTTSIGNFVGSGLSSTGLFQLSLNLATFQSTITGSSNNEFTLIITGPKDSNNQIASLGNATFAGPSLTITAIPEPSTFVLLAVGLALVIIARRRRRDSSGI